MMNLRLYTTLAILLSIQVLCFAQRNLGMSGSPNFRELGGISNKDGKKIKAGYLYRSGTISRLDEEDMLIFSGTGIKYIVDFRSEMEISRDPDTFPNNMGIVRIHAPIGTIDSNWMMKWMMMMRTAENNPEVIEQMMIEANQSFVNNLRGYEVLFELLRKGEPILWHCSAGKDRTGLASALVLHILGVERTVIFEDFLVSNNNISTDESMAAKYGLSTDTWRLLQGVKSSYLEASLSAIEQKYGSIDQMLEMEFDLDKMEKQSIRQKYLEN